MWITTPPWHYQTTNNVGRWHVEIQSSCQVRMRRWKVRVLKIDSMKFELRCYDDCSSTWGGDNEAKQPFFMWATNVVIGINSSLHFLYTKAIFDKSWPWVVRVGWTIGNSSRVSKPNCLKFLKLEPNRTWKPFKPNRYKKSKPLKQQFLGSISVFKLGKYSNFKLGLKMKSCLKNIFI